jgi:Icc-related predicted phosphoesterase
MPFTQRADGLTRILFVCDLHGRPELYRCLFRAIEEEKPRAVLMGGDLMPKFGAAAAGSGTEMPADFLGEYLRPGLTALKENLGAGYPQVFAILGNDDARAAEQDLAGLETDGLLFYAHGRALPFKSWTIYGYSFVTPTPFLLKDWERYDVSRYVDPGSVSPEEGYRSVEVPDREKKYATIKDDLKNLAGEDDLARAVFLFHSPPYRTNLDRAALDGRRAEGVPLDVNVGSIAIRRFIEDRQPMLTLHGHVHESASLTGSWRDRIGDTCMYSAAHNGPELALVKIDLERPCEGTRVLLSP